MNTSSSYISVTRFLPKFSFLSSEVTWEKYPKKCFSPKCAGKSQVKKRSTISKKKATEPDRKSKYSAMTDFAKDEKLLFSPQPSTSAASLSCIYAFPNEYTVGICSLGYQIIWRMLSEMEEMRVSRLFTDASEPLMQNPDLLGFSFSWELDYANILKMLEELQIPMCSSDRDSSHPIVFGGGPVLTTNPEPYTDFFDVVLLGDGEDLMTNFLAAVRATKGPEIDRKERLIALSSVPGVYVPSNYIVEYESAEGKIVSIRPINETVPPFVKKQTYRGRDLAVSTVVTQRMAWENIFMVEVVRSCPEMCRFCLASYSTLPFRSAPVEDSLIPSIESGLQVNSQKP